MEPQRSHREMAGQPNRAKEGSYTGLPLLGAFL